jgi:hypothetical protein
VTKRGAWLCRLLMAMTMTIEGQLATTHCTHGDSGPTPVCRRLPARAQLLPTQPSPLLPGSYATRWHTRRRRRSVLSRPRTRATGPVVFSHARDCKGPIADMAVDGTAQTHRNGEGSSCRESVVTTDVAVRRRCQASNCIIVSIASSQHQTLLRAHAPASRVGNRSPPFGHSARGKHLHSRTVKIMAPLAPRPRQHRSQAEPPRKSSVRPSTPDPQPSTHVSHAMAPYQALCAENCT